MTEYIHNINFNTIIQIDAGYRKYKFEAINILTEESAIKIYSAETQFKTLNLIKNICYILDINDNKVILLKEEDDNNEQINIQISDMNMEIYTKINNYFNDKSNKKVIITFITGINVLEIIDVQIYN